MQRLSRPNHPFPLLLYLEWILLGIALLMTFSTPFPLPHRRPRLWQAFEQLGIEPSPLGVLFCILAIGILGWRLPSQRSHTGKVLFTALGLGLSWLAAIFSAQGSNSFSALLLVVVIRSSLLFPWRERLIVAFFSFGSFVLRLILGIRYFYNAGILPHERLRSTLVEGRFSPEQVQNAIFNLTLNATLLFGLVLVFVLLMTGAILTERQSRDNLALANDRLRRYALLVENQATLQERNRIAREIHDSVGHALTAQSIQLENVAMWLDQSLPRASDHLQKARILGKEALQNVRQSVATLRQSPLHEKSLPEALQKLVQDFERTTSIKTQLQLNSTQPLPTEIAIAFYRITQEALTNIAKHSQATQVKICLQANPKGLELYLEDNGRGFNPTLNTTGFGLQSMRERTEALGGIFTVTSQPEQGCRICVTLPQSGANL